MHLVLKETAGVVRPQITPIQTPIPRGLVKESEPYFVVFYEVLSKNGQNLKNQNFRLKTNNFENFENYFC